MTDGETLYAMHCDRMRANGVQLVPSWRALTADERTAWEQLANMARDRRMWEPARWDGSLAFRERG